MTKDHKNRKRISEYTSKTIVQDWGSNPAVTGEIRGVTYEKGKEPIHLKLKNG